MSSGRGRLSLVVVVLVVAAALGGARCWGRCSDLTGDSSGWTGRFRQRRRGCRRRHHRPRRIFGGGLIRDARQGQSKREIRKGQCRRRQSRERGRRLERRSGQPRTILGKDDAGARERTCLNRGTGHHDDVPRACEPLVQDEGDVHRGGLRDDHAIHGETRDVPCEGGFVDTDRRPGDISHSGGEDHNECG